MFFAAYEGELSNTAWLQQQWAPRAPPRRPGAASFGPSDPGEKNVAYIDYLGTDGHCSGIGRTRGIFQATGYPHVETLAREAIA